MQIDLSKLEYKYVYKVKGSNYAYSGDFATPEDALVWYNEYGVWLERIFKRILVLKKIKI